MAKQPQPPVADFDDVPPKPTPSPAPKPPPPPPKAKDEDLPGMHPAVRERHTAELEAGKAAVKAAEEDAERVRKAREKKAAEDDKA